MRFLFGITFILCGIVLVVIGGASYVIIKNNVQKQVENYDLIDSANSPRVPLLFRTSNSIQRCFSLFNYTNLQAIETEIPHIEEIGPYVFDWISKDIGGVQFSNDGELLRWIGLWSYNFRESESPDLNLTIFTPLFPLFQFYFDVGGRSEEEILINYLAGGTFDYLSWTSEVIDWTIAADYIFGAQLIQSTIDQIGLDNFTAGFLDQSLENEFQLGPNSLTLEQGRILFDGSNNASMLYFDSQLFRNPNMMWYSAFQDSVAQVELSLYLTNVYNITQEDFETIYSWRTNQFSAFVSSTMISRYQIEWTPLDIMAVQITKNVFDPLRISNLLPFPTLVDLEIPPRTGSTNITVAEAQYMLQNWVLNSPNEARRLGEIDA
eukprot:TRINITY_DN9540_c0_g1_i1.p1 TRINITY_DN9540_c0_g1~~TRINITY_DN9540_c0_g1_i1.p1  ORF type:complete len:378 (-),score=55.14 TRINITY_DN9540_c0_g1_i1:20-1153(-)